MRTAHHSVSSASKVSSWLMVLLGLGAYVGLVYGLTVLPLQFEVPLPHWTVFAVPAAAYALLVLLFAWRPSVLRLIVGTVVLTGLHLLLGFAREPLTALLDPALAGRPLPWTLPTPLPEVIGVFLLLVPLRDVLRARPRLARERTSSGGRTPAAIRGRAAATSRQAATAPATDLEGLSEMLVPERVNSPEAAPAPAAVPQIAPVASTEPAAATTVRTMVDEPRRRRTATRVERHHEAARPVRRSDVVLRIGLDRIMGQLPPGTFLAPEEEVASSLRDPGHLLIPGDLVVTQLSEGVARIAWSDIAGQFPTHLIGLGSAEIEEHLGEGLRLPLDEVIGQLPHELFVADTPEVEMSGIDRIPVPFQPMEESTPAPSLSRGATLEKQPVPVMPQPRIASGESMAKAAPVLQLTSTTGPRPPAAAPAASPAPVPRVEQEVAPARDPVPVPAPARPAEPPASDGPTVRISFARIADELPGDVFGVPVEQVSGRMRQPDALLVPQSVILPQLAEGVIQVSWDVVASQFPRDLLTASDADVKAKLPQGISLPLDEVIRQVPADLFMIGGPAADVRGLESFPAPFQPLISDPEPEAPKVAPQESSTSPPTVQAAPERVAPAPEPLAAPEPDAVALPHSPEPPIANEEAPAVEELAATPAEPVQAHVPELPEPTATVAATPADLPHATTAAPTSPPDARVVVPEPTFPLAKEPRPAPPVPVATASSLPSEAPATPRPAVERPEPRVEIERPSLEDPWRGATPLDSISVGADGTAETSEARRLVAMLAPIASFEVTVQVIEGVTAFALAASTVAPEIAVSVASLVVPLFTDRGAPWSLDQVTLRGPDTAVVLTPLGGPTDRRSLLSVAAPRNGGLTLLEILCRQAAGARSRPTGPSAVEGFAGGGRGLMPSVVSEKAVALTSSLTAFGGVSAAALREAGGENLIYSFMPGGTDVPAVGALAKNLQTVMGKAAGSGVVFRTAVLRTANTLLVIQPEEVGHGRSIVVVAGGEVTRPGLAYRQVERATTALALA